MATPRKKKRALCGRRPVTPNVTNSPGEGLRPNGLAAAGRAEGVGSSPGKPDLAMQALA